MSECLGLGRSSFRAKQQQSNGLATSTGHPDSHSNSALHTLRGAPDDGAAHYRGGGGNAELSTARALVASERERCAALNDALAASQASLRELQDALTAERNASSALRAAASRHADEIALWRSKYEAAVRAGRTMAALEARPVVTAQALFSASDATQLLLPAGQDGDASSVRDLAVVSMPTAVVASTGDAPLDDKRAWLTEVQVMHATIAALRERLQETQRNGGSTPAYTDEPADDSQDAPGTSRLPHEATLPGWAQAVLRGQLVNVRARFGADVADAAEEEAASCLQAAAAAGHDGPLALEPGGGAHDEGGLAEALAERDEALRLVSELRSDWEVDAAQLHAQLAAALQRAETAERIVVAHALGGEPGTPSTSRGFASASATAFGGKFGAAAAASEAAAIVAALQSEVTHLRAALAERCETQAALEEALQNALDQKPQVGAGLVEETDVTEERTDGM